MAETIQQQKILTLVFLVHGHLGAPTDHDYLKIHIEKLFQEVNRPVLVVCSKSNHHKTNDGVENGAKNLAQEIVETVLALPPQHTKVNFVIIGHSLGGLYSKACLPLLFANEQVNEKIIPRSLITLSTPHLGSQRPGIIEGNTWAAALTIFGQTGEDLGLKSPTLFDLCDEKHRVCLLKFQHRTLVATVDGDLTVPYSTASCRLKNPHERKLFWWLKAKTSAKFSVVSHSGFTNEEQNALGFAPNLSYEPPTYESEITEQQSQLQGQYLVDSEKQVWTSKELFQSICCPSTNGNGGVFWRRIDASFNPPTWSVYRTHDMPIGKLQVPLDFPACVSYMSTIASIVELDTH